ncbi:MAG: MBL-fold metallo-hydrolase superfamily, partial [uncultured Acetobacteraceae bacterium]
GSTGHPGRRRHDDPPHRRAGGAPVRSAGVLPRPDARGAGREPRLAGIRRRARPRNGEAAPLHPVLPRPDAAAHDPGGHLRRQRQAPAGAAVLEHAQGRRLGARARRHRRRRGRDRLRDVHAPARGPRGLEHAAPGRALGADLPERALRFRPGGVRALVGGTREGVEPGHGGQRAADRRGGPGRPGPHGHGAGRPRAAGADAGAHARPLRGGTRARQHGGGAYGRPDPLALAGALPGDVHVLRLRPGAGGADAAALPGVPLRHGHAGLHRALPLAVRRARRAAGRRVPLHAAGRV